MNVVFIILAVIMAAFGIGAFIFACKSHKEWHDLEKHIEAEEKKVNETITEANNTKADARTGDHERDFNFMADKLHEFAKK